MAVNVHTEAPDRVRRLQEPHFGHEPAQPEPPGDCEDDADWTETANGDWTCATHAPGERNQLVCELQCPAAQCDVDIAMDLDAAGVMANVACPVACGTDCCPPTCVWVDPPPPPLPPPHMCGRRRLQEEGTTLTVSACSMLPLRLSSEA